MTLQVTISLTLFLLLRVHLVGFNAQTDIIIRSLIALGLKTGSYTSILAVAGAITATVFPGLSDMTTNIPEAFWVPLSGLYTLSLLSTLSSRSSLRGNLSGSGGGSGQRKPVFVDVDVTVATDDRRAHAGSRDDDDYANLGRKPVIGGPTLIQMDNMRAGQAMGMPVGFDDRARHVISFEGSKKEREAMV